MRPGKVTKEERERALKWLRENVPVGSTVHGIVRNVAPSGMSRTIDFYLLKVGKGKDRTVTPIWLTPWFRYMTGYRPAKDDRGLVVGGCGMNMIMHVVTSVAPMVHNNDDRAWRYEQL